MEYPQVYIDKDNKIEEKRREISRSFDPVVAAMLIAEDNVNDFECWYAEAVANGNQSEIRRLRRGLRQAKISYANIHAMYRNELAKLEAHFPEYEELMGVYENGDLFPERISDRLI